MRYNYWRENHGSGKSRDFIDGVIAGVKAYAILKDGQQLVGILQRPLAEVIKDIEEGLA